MMLPRSLLPLIQDQLSRGQSILLLGARQVGKTTLLTQMHEYDLSLNLMQLRARHRYEQDPGQLAAEVSSLPVLPGQKPLVYIDEIQKVPLLLDEIQVMIDQGVAQFVLSGSSAKKLREPPVNLLPGRVIHFVMTPLLIEELPPDALKLEDLLLYGTLPQVVLQPDAAQKERLLQSYVDAYLEEEVRAEAYVRKLDRFIHFLSLAGAESGRLLNIRKLSSQLGVAHGTVENFFTLLDDCLIIYPIDPLHHTASRRRLVKSRTYLMFDMGVRRVAAGEGLRLPAAAMGALFEQFVGIQLRDTLNLIAPGAKLKFWRDHNGVEVDWVVEYHGSYFPIEVKYTDAPKAHDARHCEAFLQEYHCPLGAFIISQSPRPYLIGDRSMVLPWQDLPELCRKIVSAAQ